MVALKRMTRVLRRDKREETKTQRRSRLELETERGEAHGHKPRDTWLPQKLEPPEKVWPHCLKITSK